jgi:hypothetical protein
MSRACTYVGPAMWHICCETCVPVGLVRHMRYYCQPSCPSPPPHGHGFCWPGRPSLHPQGSNGTRPSPRHAVYSLKCMYKGKHVYMLAQPCGTYVAKRMCQLAWSGICDTSPPPHGHGCCWPGRPLLHPQASYPRPSPRHPVHSLECIYKGML